MHTLFEKLVGYNRPEIHKHRKRCIYSLSRSLLLAHSLLVLVKPKLGTQYSHRQVFFSIYSIPCLLISQPEGWPSRQLK